MEFFTSVSALKTVKMLVLSNILRATHPKQMNISSLSSEQSVKENKSETENSLRIKQRTKTHDNINKIVIDDEMEEKKVVRREKCLSNSVDAIIDTKSKVICSAKGLLETNLDDLFNDVQFDDWTAEPKNLGASEPVLNFKEDLTVDKRESLVSEDDSAEDTATDSDCLDEVVREQRKCMGARRFGHMLRRVISRNGMYVKCNVFY